MSRTNGKTEVDSPELDASHELPPSDGSPDSISQAGGAAQADSRDDLQKLKSERDTLIERLARMQAEFDNARKRAAREQQEFREFALADALKTLLPILDSFERALHSDHHMAKGEFRGGIELIHKQLGDALGKLGLTPVEAKGEVFDPRLHEAIEMVDTTHAKDHEVLEELQRGYKLKDRLLRPAMVKVARNPER